MLGFTASHLGPALDKGEREDPAEGRPMERRPKHDRQLAIYFRNLKRASGSRGWVPMTTDVFFFFEVNVDDESSIECPEVNFFCCCCCCCFCYGLLAEAFRSVRGLGRVRKTALNWRVIVCIAKARGVSKGCSQ